MTTMAPEVEEEASGMEDILQVFRIFKLARVLKLARHSPGELLTYFHIIINKFLPQIPFMNSLDILSTMRSQAVFFSYRNIRSLAALEIEIAQKQTIFPCFISPGLQAIAYTLQNSYKELGLLIFLICISGFIFASLAYFIEIEEDSGFTSIPTAFYWVVITMTTIGYGDIFPVTGQWVTERRKC